MSDEPNLGELREAWKSARAQPGSDGHRRARERLLLELCFLHETNSADGLAVTPEELCGDCPELVAPLREMLCGLRDVSALLDPACVAPRVPAVAVPDHDVLNFIAHGGMGAVFRARHRELNRDVAVKVILAGTGATAKDRDLFKAEYELIARFNHPNIVQIYHVGESAGSPYFTMEYCSEGSLAQKLCELRGPGAAHRIAVGAAARAAPLPPRPVAEIALRLARAVHYAHLRGVFHRDLKPGNILFTSPDDAEPRPRSGAGPLAGLEPKIADFGLAQRLDAGSAAGARDYIGTASYMAPEQALGRGDEADARTDVYGLGAILYECLTGHPPFQADTNMETRRRVVREAVTPIRQLAPGVPLDLEAICLKCLQKSRNDRYSSAQELADDLARFLSDKPTRARPAPVAERVFKWHRRNRLLSVVVYAAVAGIAAAGIGWYRQSDRTAEQLQLRRATDELRAVLDRDPASWTDQQVSQAASLVAALDRLDEDRGVAARQELRACLTSVVSKRLDVTPIPAAEVQAISKLITAYEAKALDPDGARKLAAELNARLHQWEDLFRVAPGHTPADVFPPNALRRQGEALVRAESPPAGNPDPTLTLAFGPAALLSRQPADGNVRLQVSFDGSQESASRLALYLNASSGHTSSLSSIAVSPDGKFLATASGTDTEPGEAIVWEVATGLQVSRYESGGRKGGRYVTFSAAGDRLAVGIVNKCSIVELIDTRTWQVTASIDTDVRGLLLLGAVPDPNALPATGTNQIVVAVVRGALHVRVFAANGKVVRDMDETQFAQESGEVGELKRQLARLWPPHELTDEERARVRNAVAPFVYETWESRCAAFSPVDGKVLAVGAGVWGRPGTVQMWDVLTDSARPALRGAPLSGHTRSVQCLAFSPDGTILASGGWDSTVRFWGVQKGQLLGVGSGHKEHVRALAFSPASTSGGILASGSPDGLRLWDATTGREYPTPAYSGPAYAIAFSADGKTIALTNGSLVLCDTSGWKPRPLRENAAGCTALVFDPADPTVLYTGGKDRAVRGWNLATGCPRDVLRDCGYAFVLTTTDPESTKPVPRASLRDVPTDGLLYLQVLRNGIPLCGVTPVPAAVFPRGAITLEARREGDRLLFIIPGLSPQPVLDVVDVFSLPGTAGVFGLDLPPGIGLTSLVAQRQSVPNKARKVEDADHAFSRGRYEIAYPLYEKYLEKEGRAGDDYPRTRYKQALCLRGMSRIPEAEVILQELAGRTDERWAVMAGDQLCRLYLEDVDQPEKADKVLSRFQGDEFERLLKALPGRTRDRLLERLGRRTWGINLFQMNPAAINDLQRLDRATELRYGDPESRVTTKIALLRALWLSGRTDETCRVARDLLDSTAWPPLAPVNRIMVLEEYCWILRQIGQPAKALDKLNETLLSEPGKYRANYLPLLVARARVRSALGDAAGCEQDLLQLLKIPPRQLPYRHHTAACLMLGFLQAETPAGREAARGYWERGFWQHDPHDFLRDVRSGPDHGSLGLLQGWVLGSLSGKLTPAEGVGVVLQCFANGLDAPGGRKGIELALTLTGVPRDIMSNAWKGDRAKSAARQLAFQDLSLPDYLRSVLTITTAAAARSAVVDLLSPDQEGVLWELGDEVARAYFSGLLDKPLVFKLVQCWLGGDKVEWEGAQRDLKLRGLGEKIGDPLQYFFGHRLRQYGKLPIEVKEVFASVRSRGNARLKELAEVELRRVK